MQNLFILLQDTAAPAGAGGFANMQFIFLFGIIAVFYFFMIRPQQQRAKKERQFREALGKGDKILVFGGIHGIIDQIDGTSVLVKVDNNTKLRVEKSALQAIPE
ncbi:MAG: preprotein translocase subunit YajC [Bacteroidota bacterium]